MRNVLSILIVLSTLAFFVQQPHSDAASLLLPDEIVDLASVVVEGTVDSRETFESGGRVSTSVRVQVTEGLIGTDEFGIESGTSIDVIVPGGSLADGRTIVVSHHPHLGIDEQWQLALVPVDRGYAVVSGEMGAVRLDGGGRSQAAALGDFVLHGGRWTTMPLQYRVNPSGAGAVPPGMAIDAVRAGAQAWEDDPFSDITFDYLGSTGLPPTLHDGVNTVGWLVASPVPNLFVAQAEWTILDGEILSFDIELNGVYLWTVGALPGHYDITTVVSHEFGHVIGLDHSPAQSEVMFATIDTNYFAALGAGDLAGASTLYPAIIANPPECGGLAVTIDMTTGASGVGTSGDDVILGTSAGDRIEGLGGNDTICAGDGADVVIGGPGDDVVSGGTGSDQIIGSDGHDRLAGDGGNDRMWGGNGDDHLQGSIGTDYLHGGSGGDFLEGGADDDQLVGADDNDRLEGGDGNDHMWGQAGHDDIFGGEGDDVMQGNDGHDVLHAGAGDDSAVGGAGNDRVFGQDGDDRLWGGLDLDVVDGGSGADYLAGGGDAANVMRGGQHDDRLVGGTGPDYLRGGSGDDRMWGGLGDDLLEAEDGDDRLFGQDGFDTCDGGAGTDISTTCESLIGIP